MSRDFILVFSGGVVSLMTTLVVLFVMDYFYRRDQKSKTDRMGQVAAGHETAGNNVAVQTLTAKGSDHPVAVDQTAKPHDADLSPRQPVVDQRSKSGIEGAAAEKPTENQTKPSHAPASVAVNSGVDEGVKSKSDDSPAQKRMVDPKPELKTDQVRATTPPVERHMQPVVGDQDPKPKGQDHSDEEPAVEDKSLAKTAETAAPEPIAVQVSQPAKVGEAKPRPPHMVPPEKIKKKARDENPARPESKEHEA